MGAPPPSKITNRLVHWRLLRSPPHDGPDNMALDQALMARARRTGEAVLRTYTWSTPTLSLGRNQRARGLYDPAALHHANIVAIRRPTGGRALLHHHEITYSVTAPLQADQSGARVYAQINALLVNALAALGVPVQIDTGARPAARPSTRPCFAEPARGELVHDGRKLVASAQWRDDGAVLQHGSILVDDDQHSIAALLASPTDPVPEPATLRGILGREPLAAEMHAALAVALAAIMGVEAAELDVDRSLMEAARGLAVRYRDPAWTWRR